MKDIGKPKSDPIRECIALGECRPRHASRKDTKRWCRGKVGVEHQWEWRASNLKSAKEPGELGFRVEEEYCRACERPRDRYAFYNGRQRIQCHCGEPMAKIDLHFNEWPCLAIYHSYRCSACDYEPSSRLPTRWIDGREVLRVARKKCRCEIEAERAAKRAHYTQLYSGAKP